jgi:ethanolamine utilization protein EutN
VIGGKEQDTDTIVVWDELGATPGTYIAVSDGAEAAQPFRPALKPVDAYCSAILERVEIAPQFKSN